MKLTPETASAAVSKLALMAFFPGDPDTRGALIWALMQLVETTDQLDWLVARALKMYTRWPGVGEIRALYCSRFKPKDGVEAYSEIYQCGFPQQKPAAKIPPAREVITTSDAEMANQIRAVAGRKQLPGRVKK
jgi:hypothetical protein